MYMVVTEATLSYVSTSEGKGANLLDLHKTTRFEKGFSTLALLIAGLDNSVFWGAMLCIVGCLFNSIPGLYPLDPSSTPLSKW